MSERIEHDSQSEPERAITPEELEELWAMDDYQLLKRALPYFHYLDDIADLAQGDVCEATSPPFPLEAGLFYLAREVARLEYVVLYGGRSEEVDWRLAAASAFRLSAALFEVLVWNRKALDADKLGKIVNPNHGEPFYVPRGSDELERRLSLLVDRLLEIDSSNSELEHAAPSSDSS